MALGGGKVSVVWVALPPHNLVEALSEWVDIWYRTSCVSIGLEWPIRDKDPRTPSRLIVDAVHGDECMNNVRLHLMRHHAEEYCRQPLGLPGCE